MAAAWPERAGDPFADRMNAIPKYVVSATLGDDEVTWENTTRIPGDEAVARIRELLETDGGDLLVMGSPTLVRTLLREGLIDELRLMIEPVILGGGKTIFPDDGAPHARAGLHEHQRHGREHLHLSAGRRRVVRCPAGCPS